MSNKDVINYPIRLSMEQYRQLTFIAENTSRTRADVFRWLIQTAYAGLREKQDTRQTLLDLLDQAKK